MTKTQSGSVSTNLRHIPKVAANPIPYWLRDGKVDKSKEVFDQASADFAAIGFTAVKADVPEGMSASDYASWIAGYGLAPSLSLCAGSSARCSSARVSAPLHHSQVGGVFETENEITQLLDALGPDVNGFGPDTGHLRWAGIDPAAMIARYSDRIGGIHIKD